MMGTDLGNSIVGGEGQTSARKKSKLLAKYKVGGKVTDKKAAISNALKGKRDRLREKYATGGSTGNGVTVNPNYAPAEVLQAQNVGAKYQGSSWWQQLQKEIASLTPQSPLGSTSTAAMSLAQTAQMPQNQPASGAQAGAPGAPGAMSSAQQQPSSPTGMKRGGKVR